MTDESRLWDVPAERAVLSAVLLAPNLIRDLTLRPDDFANGRHGELWSAMLATAADGDPVDAVALTARNPSLGHLITGLADAAPSIGSARYYARTVAERAAVRRIHEAAVRIQQYTTTDRAASEIAEHARSEIDRATRFGAGELLSLTDSLATTLDRLDQQVDSIRTPWPELDEMTGGLRPGAVYVIGARPGVGKSVLGIQLARHVAEKTGVLLASLEMSNNEVNLRLLAADTGVPLYRLVNNELTDDHWTAVGKSASRLGGLPLHVDDRSRVRAIDIHARARDVTRNGPLGLVIVDYLQLIAPPSGLGSREREVAEISRSIKLMARDLSVPVVALAQLNRGSASRSDQRPVLTDLRESGAIEADADVVMLVHRDDNRTEDLDVTVAKNRHGPTGSTSLFWLPQYARADSTIGQEWRTA